MSDDSGRSASAWVLHQTLDAIRSGQVAPGERLSPERDLAASFGVSRGSVREAISALVTLGVLESRRGAGVFVTPLDPTTLLEGLGHVIGVVADRRPDDVARLHRQVEAAAAARAAARSTRDGLSAMEQALSELRLALGESGTAAASDRFTRSIVRLSEDRFHRAIARQADDPVAEGMIALLRTSRQRDARPEGGSLDLHQRLLKAIRDREPEEARSLAATLVLEEFPVTGEPTGQGWPHAGVEIAARPDARPDSARSSATPDWFRDAKLGLIVHWGVYSIPGWAPGPASRAVRDDLAGSALGEEDVVQLFAEWYQYSASVPGSPTAQYHEKVHGGRPYETFRTDFEAAVQSWSPDAWAEQFRISGARYVVQVAKHHDGYGLWPSRVRHPRDDHWRSPRDVVGELAGAVRDRGMRFGVFYSSGADWSFDGSLQAGPADVVTSQPRGADYARYVEAQWRELIAHCRPDGLWNDTGYPQQGDAAALIADYERMFPEGVVTSRFRTSRPGSLARTRDEQWESIRPIGLSFGWNRTESTADVLSGPDLVRLLLDVVSRDGNLLLGVSPDALGHLPAHQVTSLHFLGSWLGECGTGVYGTRAWSVDRTSTRDGRAVWFTVSEDALHAFVDGGGVSDITGLDLSPASTVVTADGRAVAARPSDDGVVLELPEATDDLPVVMASIRPVPSSVGLTSASGRR